MLTVKQIVVGLMLLLCAAVVFFVLFSGNALETVSSETVSSETVSSETVSSKPPSFPVSPAPMQESPRSDAAIAIAPLAVADYQRAVVVVQQPPSDTNRTVVQPAYPQPSVMIKGRKTPLDQLETTPSPVEGGGTMIHLDDSYFVE